MENTIDWEGSRGIWYNNEQYPDPVLKGHTVPIDVWHKDIKTVTNRKEDVVCERQNLICFLKSPHYGSLIYADGHGEVWTDWNDTSKFSQYGWRCTTNENSYSNRTLIGNWNQERYDLKNIVQPKPLPSQFGHYFETTYDTSYNSKIPLSTHRFKREPHWYPGHQPELDPPQYKCTEKSIYESSYSKPQVRHDSLCVWDPNIDQLQSQEF